MNFSKEQRRAAYQKLPEEVRDFVTSNGTSSIIEEILQKSGLRGEITTFADSEILYAMFGLQTLDQAITNIVSIADKSQIQLVELKSVLQKKIFDQINKMLGDSNIDNPEPTLQTIPEIKPSEKIPLAPSVVVENDLPMVLPNEKPKEVLPFEERKKFVPNIPDNKVHYQGGADPYREPI